MPPEEQEQNLPEPAHEPEPQREHVAPDYHKTENKSHKGVIIAIVLVLLLAAGGAAGHFKFYKTAKLAPTIQTATTKVAVIESSTKTYSSPNFYLTFKYPANWTVNDTGGGQMSVISPPVQLKSASGQTVTGQVEMLIRNNQQKLSEFNAGNATAVIDSQKIAYTSPSQTQRANTYLSFLQYATASNSGLDGVYITGDFGYQKGQAIPLVDVSKGDPIISVTFVKCSDSSCSGKTTPLSISQTAWDDPAFSAPIIKMLQSLSIT